jgi:hypothetical protein
MRKKPLTEKEIVEESTPASTAPRRVGLFGEAPAAKRGKVEVVRIVLKADYTVCLNGIHPTTFAAGEEAEIPIHIASVLLGDGRAHLPSGVKMEARAPENKMKPGPASNKVARRKA